MHLAPNDCLRKPEFRNAVKQNPAGNMKGLEHRDLMPQPGKFGR